MLYFPQKPPLGDGWKNGVRRYISKKFFFGFWLYMTSGPQIRNKKYFYNSHRLSPLGGLLILRDLIFILSKTHFGVHHWICHQKTIYFKKKKGPTPPGSAPGLKNTFFWLKEKGGIDMVVGKLWHLKHILYFLSHICIKL